MTEGSRKRSRTHEDEEPSELIPAGEALKDLVSKSFSYGDFFKPWRNRHFRTFALSYTQCAVEELLVDFGQNKGLCSVAEIRALIQERIGKEVADAEKRNPQYKVWAQELFHFGENEVMKVNNSLPLRKYFRVQPNELSSTSLLVPFAKTYMDDDFLRWNDETGSFFDVFRRMCGLLQTLNMFRGTTREEAFGIFKSDFNLFFKSDDFVNEVLQMNITIFKFKLEAVSKKREKFESILKKKDTSLGTIEQQIRCCESELEVMNKKMKELVEGNGFLDVLGTISPREKSSFIADIERAFESKFEVVGHKLSELKRQRDVLNISFTDELESVVGKSGTGMMLREIEYYEQSIAEAKNTLEDDFARAQFVNSVKAQFEEESTGIKSLCEYVSLSPEFLKIMIKSLSKIISSKEVMLEGMCKMASDLKRNFI